jgi:hypothetical protein
MHKQFWSDSLKRRGYLGDLDMGPNDSVMSKCERGVKKVLAGFLSLVIGN